MGISAGFASGLASGLRSGAELGFELKKAKRDEERWKQEQEQFGINKKSAELQQARTQQEIDAENERKKRDQEAREAAQQIVALDTNGIAGHAKRVSVDDLIQSTGTSTFVDADGKPTALAQAVEQNVANGVSVVLGTNKDAAAGFKAYMGTVGQRNGLSVPGAPVSPMASISVDGTKILPAGRKPTDISDEDREQWTRDYSQALGKYYIAKGADPTQVEKAISDKQFQRTALAHAELSRNLVWGNDAQIAQSASEVLKGVPNARNIEAKDIKVVRSKDGKISGFNVGGMPIDMNQFMAAYSSNDPAKILEARLKVQEANDKSLTAKANMATAQSYLELRKGQAQANQIAQESLNEQRKASATKQVGDYFDQHFGVKEVKPNEAMLYSPEEIADHKSRRLNSQNSANVFLYNQNIGNKIDPGTAAQVGQLLSNPEEAKNIPVMEDTKAGRLYIEFGGSRIYVPMQKPRAVAPKN